ncbi:MAG: spore cortex biosynthesis protein YabQ [Lachnospiraceae bacterium]|nr:spore cortex biosynthesis protein YabQ [Lachnospiraceae bacterium]
MIFHDEEWQVIFRALCLGIRLSLLYDLLRGLRRMRRGSRGYTFAYDIFFWICTATLSFRLMHEYGNGLLRWYVVGAAFLAMWIYGKILGRLLHRLFQHLAVPAKIILTKLKRLAIMKVKTDSE